MDKTTTYIYDNDHDYYECSSCGLVWALGNEFSLKENQMYYCPQCGRHIVGVEGGGSK